MPTLPVNTGASAILMAQEIFGSGVTVVSASCTGDRNSSGIYNGDSVSPGVTPSDTGVILSTGRVRDFTNSSGQTNQSTNTSGPNNLANFNALAGAPTHDTAILGVDFVPTSDTMTMQFVFSSGEYPEYSGSIYNDVAAVWIAVVTAARNTIPELKLGATEVLATAPPRGPVRANTRRVRCLPRGWRHDGHKTMSTRAPI